MTGGARIRVLIAEDDPAVRGALSRLISREPGFELVDAVPGATEAIEAAAREHPDVALVDVRMPGGGPSAARGIRRLSPDTKVLALSALDDRPTVLQMVEAGVVGYLVKGSPVEHIVDSIERAAAGQGSLSVEVTGDVLSELAGELSERRRVEGRRHRREARIRRALQDENVLRMVFQPICALSGQTVGAEALARFDCSPQRGPDRWFAEASEVGLRRELELAAARAALERISELPEDVYLSVNASPETLSAASFRKLLAHVDGSRVVVEVTEHAPIDDYDGLRAALARLRLLGVRLAVDDAGAGFASLRHILQLGPDFIKLDRSLVTGIENDLSQQALASGLISFARVIGATIVAEGVERETEIEALAGLGVECAQGFFFGRPGPLPLQAAAMCESAA
jgi:EAL domain-containing protein (putative c-di-GMP-specific phosphodiesterase class I)/DNA-binding NarL/FixJ family response regulator